jgi:hypothetical protein
MPAEAEAEAEGGAPDDAAATGADAEAAS